MQPLEALQQREKTKLVALPTGFGSRQANSSSVGVKKRLNSRAVRLRLNRGYAVRSTDGMSSSRFAGGGASQLTASTIKLTL
jgi:hypothetical protein